MQQRSPATVFLVFLHPAAQLSETDFTRELAHTARRLKQLQPLFKATNVRLGTNREYIKHVIKESRRNDKTEPDPTLDFDAQVDDEDLMGGVVATG